VTGGAQPVQDLEGIFADIAARNIVLGTRNDGWRGNGAVPSVFGVVL
jgi:hypothetical protein